MPLRARRYIRKMRGGAQSHLLECDDEQFYVVKFQNNPQHRRILTNELIASVCLEYLQISAPPARLVEVGADFLSENPDVHLTLGSRHIPVEPGWHFGSLYPGHPEHVAVYDFLPDALLSGVTNLADFAGILVFDKWASNVDGRQSIFFRAAVQAWREPGRTSAALVARMIDHGFILNGPNWDFADSPVQGLYPRRAVYDRVRSLDDFQPWLDMVRYFPEQVLDAAYRRIPPAWIEGEEEQLGQALETLLARRRSVPELIMAARQSRTNPFANWR